MPLGRKAGFMRRICWLYTAPLGCLLALWGNFHAPGAAEPFLRGDVDESSRLEITDALRIFQFLFQGGGGISCQDAADVDDNGAIEIADGISLLNYLFRQGSPPPAPFPDCGNDPSDDALGCDRHEGCEFRLDIPGLNVSGEGVFFVIDRSRTMQDRRELGLAKREVVGLIKNFPEAVQFGVVFFETGVIKFPSEDKPAQATADLKTMAKDFVVSVRGGSGTCQQKGLVAALKYVDASTATRNVILYLSDGGGECAGYEEHAYLKDTLDVISRENHGRARIFTIGVMDLRSEDFLKQLAAQNGGSYLFIKG